MATRIGLFVITIVLLVACSLLLAQSEALYVPKGRALAAAAGDVAKRSANIAQRQKRYTDYQERASAFCTGLCMYEERKSYSECFDLCNWHLSQGPNYKVPSKESSYSGPLSPVQSPTVPSAGAAQHHADHDYSNDQPALTDWPPSSATSASVDAEKSTSTSPSSADDDDERRKGKKPKGTKVAADKRRRLLKELRRRLLKDIDSKQRELSERAQALERKIGSLESEIELGKRTIADFEQRLRQIKLEMARIDGLKANIGAMIRGSRRLAAGRKTRPDGPSLPESLLLSADGIQHRNVTDLLDGLLGAVDRGKRFDGLRSFELSRTDGDAFSDNSWSLGEAKSNLEHIVADDLNHDYANGLP